MFAVHLISISVLTCDTNLLFLLMMLMMLLCTKAVIATLLNCDVRCTVDKATYGNFFDMVAFKEVSELCWAVCRRMKRKA